MAILKCKMCGGDIELSADKTFGTCDSCGSLMTFPKVDDEQRANMFNRGNHFRRTGEFDKALAVYERIVQEDENDAEAHWCCALCRFGIEYVEDPNTFEYLPTCHRASFDSFLEDVDYLAALEHSDGITRRQYQKDAAKIAEVQRGILATSQNEEPFDVFICYKESENDGTRTRDSLMAQEIYYQLTEQGRRVFFSRITLEDKAGTEYEPYIFAALNSAKVMIVVTTSAEHVNAVWVKNEWSRFLSLMRKDRTKLLLPCYRDMDPYDLPEALSVLQSYDMGKIGFIQDLTRGVNKVLDASAPKTKETIKETVVVQQTQTNANVAQLLDRAFLALEDGEWEKADAFCEQALNLDARNAEAYLGKLMAELHVRTRDALKDQPEPFNDRNNYKKAYRFGDEKLKAKLSGDIAFIKERNETARLTGIYNNGVKAMNAASTESAYKSAAAIFKTIPGFRDADVLAERCLNQAEVARKDAIYQSALSQIRKGVVFVHNYESAIKGFCTIPGWKDADEQILVCQRKIEEIKAKEEADRLERERKAEEARIAEEKRKKRNKKIALIVLAVIAVVIAAVILFFTVIQPNMRYNKAKALYEAGQYEDAITAFTALDGYRDSVERITECKNEKEYVSAIAAMEEGQYDNAIKAFSMLDGYKDSKEKIEEIKNGRYTAAVDLYNAEKYEEAITAFTALDGYKDSVAQIEKCETAIKDEKYAAAVELYTAGKYEDAIAAFTALDGYKDSAAQIEKCETAIKEKKYTAAAELYHAGKYEEAITALIDLNGYKDSESIKTKCMFAKAPVGSAVFFGEYEQDNDMSNGKEQIEWLVLDKDKDSVLAISKYCLFCTSELSQVQFVYEKNNVSAYLTLFMNGSFMFDYYNFNYHDDYIFETGSFTYQNGELILTSENGTVVKGEGKSSIQLHYCYQGNDRISGDFSIPSGTFKVNIVPSGTDNDFFSLCYETLFEELMTFSETAFSDEEKLFMQNSGSQVIILPSDQLSLFRNEADKRTSATAFAINQGAYVGKNKKATWYVRSVDADSPTIGYVVANTSDLNNDDYSTPSYDRICIRPAIRIYFGNSIGD